MEGRWKTRAPVAMAVCLISGSWVVLCVERYIEAGTAKGAVEGWVVKGRERVGCGISESGILRVLMGYLSNIQTRLSLIVGCVVSLSRE